MKFHAQLWNFVPNLDFKVIFNQKADFGLFVFNPQKANLTKNGFLKELNLYFNIMNVKLFLLNQEKAKKAQKVHFTCVVQQIAFFILNQFICVFHINWFKLVENQKKSSFSFLTQNKEKCFKIDFQQTNKIMPQRVL